MVKLSEITDRINTSDLSFSGIEEILLKIKNEKQLDDFKAGLSDGLYGRPFKGKRKFYKLGYPQGEKIIDMRSIRVASIRLAYMVDEKRRTLTP